MEDGLASVGRTHAQEWRRQGGWRRKGVRAPGQRSVVGCGGQRMEERVSGPHWSTGLTDPTLMCEPDVPKEAEPNQCPQDLVTGRRTSASRSRACVSTASSHSRALPSQSAGKGVLLASCRDDRLLGWACARGCDDTRGDGGQTSGGPTTIHQAVEGTPSLLRPQTPNSTSGQPSYGTPICCRSNVPPRPGLKSRLTASLCGLSSAVGSI